MLRHIVSPHHDDTWFSENKYPWWHCLANLWSSISFISFVTLFPSYWLWKTMKYATIQPLLVHVLAIHHHRTVMKNHYCLLFTIEFPSLFPHAPSKLQVQPHPPVPTTSWSSAGLRGLGETAQRHTRLESNCRWSSTKNYVLYIFFK